MTEILISDKIFWTAYGKMDEICKFYKCDIVNVKPLTDDIVNFNIMKNDKPVFRYIWIRDEQSGTCTTYSYSPTMENQP